MATAYQFVCKDCGYNTEVVGADEEWTFFVGVGTFCCTVCKEIFDAVVRRMTDGPPKSRADGTEDLFRPVRPRCGKNPKHPLVPWREGDRCPKCDGRMRRSGLEAILD